MDNLTRHTAGTPPLEAAEETAAAAARLPVGKPSSDGEFEGLVARHRKELRHHAYRATGSWADADDIVQQTFFNYWRIRSAAAITNVRAFLFKMVGNASQDSRRAAQVRASFAQDEVLRALSASRSAEEICATEEELARLLRHIQDLPLQYQRALLMYRHEGLTLEEIGQRLGIQKKSVSKALSRAMKYLLDAEDRQQRGPK